MNGLRRHILDFEIVGGTNPCKINIVDQSAYMEPPETPRYEVITPGKTVPVVVAYIPGQVTVLNASLLGLADPLDCSGYKELPDGLYKVTQSVCPHDQLFACRLYLRTTLLEECFARILVKPRLLEHTRRADRELLRGITDVDILLQSARAEAMLGNETKAIEKFERTGKLIDKIFKLLK